MKARRVVGEYLTALSGGDVEIFHIKKHTRVFGSSAANEACGGEKNLLNYIYWRDLPP